MTDTQDSGNGWEEDVRDYRHYFRAAQAQKRQIILLYNVTFFSYDNYSGFVAFRNCIKTAPFRFVSQ